MNRIASEKSEYNSKVTGKRGLCRSYFLIYALSSNAEHYTYIIRHILYIP